MQPLITNAVDRNVISQKIVLPEPFIVFFFTVSLRQKCEGYVGHLSARMYNVNRIK